MAKAREASAAYRTLELVSTGQTTPTRIAEVALCKMLPHFVMYMSFDGSWRMVRWLDLDLMAELSLKLIARGRSPRLKRAARRHALAEVFLSFLMAVKAAVAIADVCF